jgi:hypothetical protein
MNRSSTQSIKNSQTLRNKRQVKQTNQRTNKVLEIESIIKIQRWWRKIHKKIVSLTQITRKIQNFKSKLKKQRILEEIPIESKSSFDFEQSFFEKPSTKQTNPVSSNESPRQSFNLNSSIQSKAAELFQYLEDSEQKPKAHLKQEVSMNYNSQAAILNYKLELEEAMKTIDLLKMVIQRQKKDAVETDEENKKQLESALEKQRIEYEEIGIKNISFIEQLLAEKQQRINQLTELNNKVKDLETKHQKHVIEIKEQAAKELKKQKDAWVTTEKNKKTSWIKEKTKEIKETTAKGLEPEIMRIIAENKRQIEKIKEDYEQEMKKYKIEVDQDFDSKLMAYKEDIKLKYDEMLEKERESYQERLRDLHFKQEEDLMSMRKRWSDDMNIERQKMSESRLRDESNYQSKLKILEEEYFNKIQEINTKNKNTLEDLERNYENKLRKAIQEHNLEKDEWVQSQMNRMVKDFEDKKDNMRNELIQTRDKELKNVISKLSEEKVSYKKKLEKECELKIKCVQEKHASEISDYEKFIENLKEKIEKSTTARKNLDDNFQTLGKRIQDQEALISKLESDKIQLKDVITGLEVRLENYKEGQSEVVDEIKKEEKRKQMLLQEEIDVSKEQIKLLKEKYEEKIAQITLKETEEFEAIEARVKATIMRKDDKIREIQEELQLSKMKISKLEELLEKQRKNLIQL